MKRIVFLLAILAATYVSNAQGNANEAKAAYMLAEESYGKGDYRTALEYLQQAKTALGATNCKVLYLQIMVTKELNAKNPKAPNILLPLIAEFEQAPDYKDFNEDKSLEITKLKLAMKLEQKALKEQEDKQKAELEAEAAVERAIDRIFSRYPPLDITLAELDALHPNMKLKNWKANKTFPTVKMSPNMDQVFTRERYPFGRIEKNFDSSANPFVSFQLMQHNGVERTLSYAGILVYADKEIGDVASANAAVNAVMERYTREMGKPAIAVDTDDKDAHYTVYRWKTKKKQLDLCKLFYPKGNQPVVKLIEEARINW